MPTSSGKKRVRKEGSSGKAMKKLKANSENEAATTTATAAVVQTYAVATTRNMEELAAVSSVAAPVAVVNKGIMSYPQKARNALAERTKEQQQPLVSIGKALPYEEKHPVAMKQVTTVNTNDKCPKKEVVEAAPRVSLNNGNTVDHHHNASFSFAAKRKALFGVVVGGGSGVVPCFLLFLVVLLFWSSVTLLGLLLSERLDHYLQLAQFKEMLLKSQAVGIPPPPAAVEDLQKNVQHWRNLVKNLELQKTSMLQKFGEKLASLESME
jgi:hypothetical protein